MVRQKAKDRIGQTFGRLKVKDCYKKNGRSWFICDCSCGEKNIHIIYHSVTCGKTLSCGCYRKTLYKKKHGMSEDKIYNVWKSMKNRVNCESHSSYSHYGGLGIEYCEEWENFEKFFEDMGYPPSKNHSLDRIDNTKGYSKDNCRWSTKSVQMRNQNKRLKNAASSVYKGVTKRDNGNCDACLTMSKTAIRIWTGHDEELAAKYYNFISKYLYGDLVTLNEIDDLSITIEQAEMLHDKIQNKFLYSEDVKEYIPREEK